MNNEELTIKMRRHHENEAVMKNEKLRMKNQKRRFCIPKRRLCAQKSHLCTPKPDLCKKKIKISELFPRLGATSCAQSSK